jgi:hypothetical protein
LPKNEVYLDYAFLTPREMISNMKTCFARFINLESLDQVKEI